MEQVVTPYRAPGDADLPFHEYVRQQLFGVKELEVFPRPDRLAKLRFAIGAETPLVLVDDTVMQSCKAGILLTSHAIYMLIDGRRVDLSIVRGGPHYPRGENEVGYIDTTQGAFPFPAFTQDETRAGLERVIELAVAYGQGERTSPLGDLALRGPISSAAVHVFFGAGASIPKILPPWNVSRKKRDGLRVFSRGMDHPGGEEVLAVIDETAFGKCDEGVVVTDRALHVRSGTASAPNDVFTAPYAYVMNATATGGIFGRTLTLALAGGLGPREISLIVVKEAIDPLHRFLMTVLQMHPQARAELRVQGGPRVGDPTLLGYVDVLGLPPVLADDLRERLRVQHCNERWGRGANEGWSLSPLSIGDLRVALPVTLGQPIGEHWDGRVLTLDFTLRQGGGGVGGAVASSLVGVALLATVGIGWISVPKGPTVRNVRVRVCELPGGSGIRVTGLAGAEIEAPEVASAVDQGLVAVEHEMMRRRCIFGLELPAPALLALDDATLATQASELTTRASQLSASR